MSRSPHCGRPGHSKNGIPYNRGFIVAHRVDHTQPEEGDDAYPCGICFNPMWIAVRTQIFRSVYPAVPIICCRCSTASEILLRQAIPNLATMTEDVPDLSELARTGAFN